MDTLSNTADKLKNLTRNHQSLTEDTRDFSTKLKTIDGEIKKHMEQLTEKVSKA